LVGALPQTPLGELTALPRPLAAVSDLTSKGKGMGRGRESGEEGKGEGRGNTSPVQGVKGRFL